MDEAVVPPSYCIFPKAVSCAQVRHIKRFPSPVSDDTKWLIFDPRADLFWACEISRVGSYILAHGAPLPLIGDLVKNILCIFS